MSRNVPLCNPFVGFVANPANIISINSEPPSSANIAQSLGTIALGPDGGAYLLQKISGSTATWLALGNTGGSYILASGSATLALGTVTVTNSDIDTADLIILQRQDVGSSTLLGQLTYTISDGASFTITSKETATPADTEVGDLSVVKYIIVRGA